MRQLDEGVYNMYVHVVDFSISCPCVPFVGKTPSFFMLFSYALQIYVF